MAKYVGRTRKTATATIEVWMKDGNGVKKEELVEIVHDCTSEKMVEAEVCKRHKGCLVTVISIDIVEQLYRQTCEFFYANAELVSSDETDIETE